MYTMKDLNSSNCLGSVCEIELEKALRINSKSVSEFTNKYNDLLGLYSNFEKRSNREKTKLNHNLEQADTNIGKLSE
ncbi:10931_t:CDS:1, partial [Funneliformis geosporum]